MNLYLYREPSVGRATLGRLFHGEEFVCDVLEDVVREVPGEPVESWKIHGETAIPAGTYNVTMETSARFGPRTITLNSVPGFEGIRVHAGNYAKDTEGCLLVGERDSCCTITHSKITLATVKDMINIALLEDKELVTLQIFPAMEAV
jgi:hypothetical protein